MPQSGRNFPKGGSFGNLSPGFRNCHFELVKLSSRLFGLCRNFAQIFWNMKTRMKTLKAFVLFLGLLMLTATQMNAQNKGGGLFGMGPSGEASPHRSLLNPSGGNITNQTYGSDADGFGITNQTYGLDAPLGSGLLIMAVAGACYAGMKRNKKQTKK